MSGAFVEQANCVNYPKVPCLCRGAARNGGATCIRQREIERARASREAEKEKR